MGCCASAPDFDLKEVAREGEDAAGWLFKRGKNVATLKRRFFVLRDCALTYYALDDREGAKGFIKLGPRASAAQLTGPESSKGGKHAFRITHPQCGSRELLALSRGAADQWVRAINAHCEAAKAAGSRQSFMLKRGGVTKNSWQQRWCSFVASSGQLSYYSDPTESAPRGVIELATCTVSATTRDKKACFELLSRDGANAKTQRRIFACDTMVERDM